MTFNDEERLDMLERAAFRRGCRHAKKGGAMRWTREKPTEPGWYWQRNTLVPHVQPSPVEIVRSVAGELIVCWSISHRIKIGDVSPYSEWQGPITPKEDAT